MMTLALAALPMLHIAPAMQEPVFQPGSKERYILIVGQELIGEVRVRAFVQSPGGDSGRQSYISFDSDPSSIFVSRIIRPTLDTKGTARFSGRIVYVDSAKRESGVMSFTNARVSAIRIPLLDRESQENLVLRVSLIPQSSTYARGSNKSVSVPAPSTKTWSASDFKVTLGNLPPDEFIKAGPININFNNGLTFSPFAVTYRSRGADQAPPPQPARPTITVQLLDSAGVNALTVNLGNCVLKRIPSDDQFIVSPPIVRRAD